MSWVPLVLCHIYTSSAPPFPGIGSPLWEKYGCFFGVGQKAPPASGGNLKVSHGYILLASATPMIFNPFYKYLLRAYQWSLSLLGPPLYWSVGWIQRNQTWVLFKGTNSLLERQSSPLLYACGPKCQCYIRPENEELNIG